MKAYHRKRSRLIMSKRIWLQTFCQTRSASVYSDSRLQRTKDLCNNLYFFVAYFANIWYNTQCKQK
jgi:hypothetical protein